MPPRHKAGQTHKDKPRAKARGGQRINKKLKSNKNKKENIKTKAKQKHNQTEKDKICMYDYYNKLIDYLWTLGYKKDPVSDNRQRQKEWERFNANNQIGTVKYIKFKLDAFTAYWMSAPEEIPLPKGMNNIDTQDKRKHLLGGRPGRFIKQILGGKVKGVNVLNLVQGFRSLKGSLFPVPKEMVEQGMSDTFNALTQPNDDPSLVEILNLESKIDELTDTIRTQGEYLLSMRQTEDWNEPDPYEDNLEEMIDYLNIEYGTGYFGIERRILNIINQKVSELNKCQTLKKIRDSIIETVHEVLTEEFNPKAFGPAIIPSTSANYIDNSMDGGSVYTLMNDPEFRKLFDGTESRRLQESIEQQWMEEADTYEKRESRMDEIILLGKLENLQNVPNIIDREVQRSSQYSKVLAYCFEKVKNFAQTEERPHAVLHGLAEPLKVRVISKMCPYLMTLFKPLQTWMHKQLKLNRAFKLVGEPTNWEYIQDVFGADNKDIIISSDYSAATDNLHSWCSELCAREITSIIYKNGNYYDIKREEFSNLLLKTLTQHEILFHLGSKIEIKRGPQTRGQLMGSITSFPILCLINAGVNRLLFKKKAKLSSLKICINGDDIALASGCTFQEHKVLNTFVGSKLSPGKVFMSEKYMNINSRFIVNHQTGKEVEKLVERDGVLKTVKRIQRWSEVEFIPMGVICCAQNNGSHSTYWMDMIGQAGTRYLEAIKSFPSKEHLILSLFKKYNSNHYKKSKLPWYVPTWLGGLGLYTEYTSKLISHVDLKICNKIMANMKELKFPRNLNHTKKMWLLG
jgi:hypothetical protein